MPAKKIKTKAVERSEYRTYLKKAAEFYDLMCEAQRLEKWNGLGLNAVHCAISSADALLVFYAGIRSADDDHLSAVSLLSASVQISDIGSKRETLRKILVKKSLIEYECRDFSQKEALEIMKLTERFHKWVVSCLK